MKEIIEDFFITPEIEEDKETFQKDLYDWQKSNFTLYTTNTKYNESFSSYLDQAGDCVNRLFHKPEKFKDGRFSYSDAALDVSNVPLKKLFRYSPISDACFMYNLQPKKDYEILIISAKNKNEGWVWLMCSRPTKNSNFDRDLFYRELVLEKRDNKWIVTLGQGGEIKISNYKKFKKSNIYAKDSKWYNITKEKLFNEKEFQDTHWKSLNLYWKPKNDSNEKLSQLLSDTEDQIIRLNKEKENQIYKNGNRKSIYWKEKWHTKLSKHKNKPLIKLKSKNITELNGEWKDLYNICENAETNPKPNKDQQTYCFYKKNVSTQTHQKPRPKADISNPKIPEVKKNVDASHIPPNTNDNTLVRNEVEVNPKGGEGNKKTETPLPSLKDTGRSISPEEKGKSASVKIQSSIDEVFLTKQNQENEVLNGKGINEKKQELNESSTPDTKRESSEITNATGTENNQGHSVENKEHKTKKSEKETKIERKSGIETLEEVTESPISNLREDNQVTPEKVNPFNYKLDFNEEDFYKSFDNPGDCITRLFTGIKESSVFKSSSGSNNLNLTTPVTVFNNNKRIVSACYQYHYKNSDNDIKQRLEIGARTENEGWVWMMASKPAEHMASNAFHLYFRELVLEKNDGNWKVKIGQEGLIRDDRGNVDGINFKIANFVPNFEWSIFEQSKFNQEKSLNLYWKSDLTSSKKFHEITYNAYDQVVRWGNRRKEFKNKRKRIYWNENWNTNVSGYNGKQLIQLENGDLATTKGTWNSLLGFCVDDSSEKRDKANYDIYCK